MHRCWKAPISFLQYLSYCRYENVFSSLQSLCFNNKGGGCLLEASIYHSNNKNKMGIGNFMQHSSLQLSWVLCSVLLFSSLESSCC